MNPADGEFGAVDSIDAEAVGRPGNRRFRLIAIGAGRSASIWMEKVQLAGIAEWLDETAVRLDESSPLPSADTTYVAPIPLNFDIELRVGQLGLGYLEEEAQFTIQAFDIEGGRSGRARGRPSFSCQISRLQAKALSGRIAEVVAGGRPICPLCQSPIDPDGHVCPRSNGHAATTRV